MEEKEDLDESSAQSRKGWRTFFDTGTERDRGTKEEMNGRNKTEATVDINAFLGEHTNFKGVLAFEGTVRIDGRLEGEVISEDTLIVGENAIVNAEINVGTVIISGKVTGDIVAKNCLEIVSPGEVHGNIKTPSLTIAKGVIFQGTCEMGHEIDKKYPISLDQDSKIGSVLPKEDKEKLD